MRTLRLLSKYRNLLQNYAVTSALGHIKFNGSIEFYGSIVYLTFRSDTGNVTCIVLKDITAAFRNCEDTIGETITRSQKWITEIVSTGRSIAFSNRNFPTLNTT